MISIVLKDQYIYFSVIGIEKFPLVLVSIIMVLHDTSYCKHQFNRLDLAGIIVW